MLEFSSNMSKKVLFFILFLLSVFQVNYAQNDECDGAAIRTHESYLYGRFETKMKSTQGSGIVSSFFLYNWDIGCNWPASPRNFCQLSKRSELVCGILPSQAYDVIYNDGTLSMEEEAAAFARVYIFM